MAVVESYNKSAVDALVAPLVESASVDSAGNLVLTKQDSSTATIAPSNAISLATVGLLNSDGTGSQAGKYQKVASITLTAQFNDEVLDLLIIGQGSGTGPSTYFSFSTRVKQQAAMGSAPWIEVNVQKVIGTTLSEANIIAITTQNDGTATVVELWFMAPQNFENYQVYQVAEAGPGARAYPSPTNVWTASGSLPAGTQTAAGRVGVGLAKVAATANAGFTLLNSTPTILTWTTPNDGKTHFIQIVGELQVTTTEVGGTVSATYTRPDGTGPVTVTISVGAQSTGDHPVTTGLMVAPNTTVTLAQTAALTSGAAKIWLAILAQ